MNADRALKVMNWSVAAIVAAAVALWLGSCAGLWGSVKSAAIPAGGAAAGAAAGSLAGPVGTIAGAGVGAIVGHSVGENAELRSGTLQGEGARDAEMDRIKSLLMLSQGDLQVKERALAMKEEALKHVEGAFGRVKTWTFWILLVEIVVFGFWFRWRNRHNIRELGFFKGMLHALMGGSVGKQEG